MCAPAPLPSLLCCHCQAGIPQLLGGVVFLQERYEACRAREAEARRLHREEYGSDDDATDSGDDGEDEGDDEEEEDDDGE